MFDQIYFTCLFIHNHPVLHTYRMPIFILFLACVCSQNIPLTPSLLQPVNVPRLKTAHIGLQNEHFPGATSLFQRCAQEQCESRGGRPGLPSLISLRFCGRKATLNHQYCALWCRSFRILLLRKREREKKRKKLKDLKFRIWLPVTAVKGLKKRRTYMPL